MNKLSRRTFIKATAASAAFPYVISSSALGKAGSVSPSNRITMGAIGVGAMGAGDLRGFVGKKEVQMLAVCDVDSRHLEQAKHSVDRAYDNQNCDAYTDFRDLLDRDDIDAVMIATPDHWHAVQAIMAVKSKKHVHCQKPLAYTIAEGRAMCDAVEKYKVTWQTGSQQRSDKDFRRACELIRNGRIGKVHTVNIGLPHGHYVNFGSTNETINQPPEGFDYDMWLGPAPEAPYSPARCHRNFRWVSDYSGGQITDWAGHHCDIAQWAMGTDRTSPVQIQGKGTFPKDGLFDTVYEYRFECKFDEGFTMIISDVKKLPKQKDGLIFADGCHICEEDRKALGVLFEGSNGWIHVNRGGITANPQSVLNSVIGPNEIHLYESNDHKQNFLDCIKSGEPTVAPAEVAHRSIMIGHLGIIAMKTGSKLKWDPVNERFENDEPANRYLSRPMRSPWHL